MTRERTYAWTDPVSLAARARELSGLEMIHAIRSGELPPPPAAETTGLLALDAGPGWALFGLEPQEWHYNPLGSVHGGILSTLADTALGCAVHTKLPAGTGYTSLDLTVKFTRAATLASGLLTCRADVVAAGRRTATAEARITDTADRVVAHAVTTCLVL
ncbi:PaaI family thioesterase [Nocardioides sp. SYSU D00038]|uniref:PaaI family thioesterase n=1 Tax=Nocardioides sp. SYSU D00038 TaxID=2812554 RepID=UPI001967E2DD|nr:PaaI family thioesterase [Nocardioides sp. SYSU D00038]